MKHDNSLQLSNTDRLTILLVYHLNMFSKCKRVVDTCPRTMPTSGNWITKFVWLEYGLALSPDIAMKLPDQKGQGKDWAKARTSKGNYNGFWIRGMCILTF